VVLTPQRASPVGNDHSRPNQAGSSDAFDDRLGQLSCGGRRPVGGSAP
jgi:hypothetical protein